MVTRKLRRRHCDPVPTVEKRRKVAPLSSLVYILDENEVDDDIKVIFKVRTAIRPIKTLMGGGGLQILPPASLCTF